MSKWDGNEQRRNNSGLKIFGGLCALIFSATLAYIVGERLSDEALGVLAGAVCGVGAAIPSTILVLFAAKAMRGGFGRQQEQQPMMTRPMVVPPQVMYYPPQQLQEQNRQTTWSSRSRQREFQVVGDDGDGYYG